MKKGDNHLRKANPLLTIMCFLTGIGAGIAQAPAPINCATEESEGSVATSGCTYSLPAYTNTYSQQSHYVPTLNHCCPGKIKFSHFVC